MITFRVVFEVQVSIYEFIGWRTKSQFVLCRYFKFQLPKSRDTYYSYVLLRKWVIFGLKMTHAHWAVDEMKKKGICSKIIARWFLQPPPDLSQGACVDIRCIAGCGLAGQNPRDFDSYALTYAHSAPPHRTVEYFTALKYQVKY